MGFLWYGIIAAAMFEAVNAEGCCTPDQWQGLQVSLTGVVKNGQPSSTQSSTMVYYDYTNKRLAASTNATTPAGQKAVLILSLYESSEGGVQYTLDLMTKTCSKKQITSPMEKQCIPEFAKRDPQTIFYGSGESKLKAQRYSMNIQPGMLSATVSTTPDQCVPVTEVVYGVLDSTTGESVLQAIEFNDVTVGISRPDIFNVPKECQQAETSPAVETSTPTPRVLSV